MLLKLHALEEVLVQVSKQYHVVATELANLKNKPNNEPVFEATIADLKKQLVQTQTALSTLEQDHKKNQSSLQEKTRQLELLNEENRLLLEENKQLKDKNRLAIERAETIQTWLHNIDTAKNN